MTATNRKIKIASFIAAIATASLLLASVFAFTAPVQSAYAREPVFDSIVPLITNSGIQGFSNYDTVAVGANVYAVWHGTIGENSAIFLKRSVDNGKNFDTIINLSRNIAKSFDPQIAALGTNVYVVWHAGDDGSREVYFARSTDNGITFEVVDLSNNAGNSEFPQIAISGSNVYVIWRNNTSGNYEVYLRVSTDGGATFGDTINLSKNSGDSTINSTINDIVQIVASGSNVYAVWQDRTFGKMDVVFTRSTDNGATFSDPINISNTNGYSHHPTLAVSGNNVYIVWFDDTHTGGQGAHYGIYFARSIDNGMSFSDPIILSNDSGDNGSLHIGASGSNVYVTFSRGTGFPAFDLDIYFVRSTDNGATFSNAINLSGSRGTSSNAQLAVAGNNVYVAWQDNASGNFEILFATSVDNGASFNSPVNLSNNGGDSAGARMAISESNLHTMWSDNTPQNNDLFFRVGTILSN